MSEIRSVPNGAAIRPAQSEQTVDEGLPTGRVRNMNVEAAAGLARNSGCDRQTWQTLRNPHGQARRQSRRGGNLRSGRLTRYCPAVRCLATWVSSARGGGRIGKTVRTRRGPAAVSGDERCTRPLRYRGSQASLAPREGAASRTIREPEDLPRVDIAGLSREKTEHGGRLRGSASPRNDARNRRLSPATMSLRSVRCPFARNP